MIQYFII